jgi:hypothetical protein
MTDELRSLIDRYQSWLHLPDPSPVQIALAAIAANLGKGRPVWLLFVGPPSSGKTAIFETLERAPKVFPVSELTVAGLMSGSKREERSEDCKGGLLGNVGDLGILIAKDFGSVLNMRPEARQSLLMALREIYDGRWARDLGTDGGTRYEWKGKLGLIGSCTAAIDRLHGVMNVMGERFTLFRMPRIDGYEQCRSALDNEDKFEQIGNQIGEAVAQFFLNLNVDESPTRSDQEREWLIALAMFVATCRTATDRDNYSRQIEIASEPEGPARLVKVFDRLRAGLSVIGMDGSEIWPLIRKVAFDSLPLARARIIQALESACDCPLTLADLAETSSCSANATRRHLEDLEIYGAIDRQKGGTGRGDEYLLSEWATEKLRAIASLSDNPPGATSKTVPEISTSSLLSLTDKTGTPGESGKSDKSGTVPSWPPTDISGKA